MILGITMIKTLSGFVIINMKVGDEYINKIENDEVVIIRDIYSTLMMGMSGMEPVEIVKYEIVSNKMKTGAYQQINMPVFTIREKPKEVFLDFYTTISDLRDDKIKQILR